MCTQLTLYSLFELVIGCLSYCSYKGMHSWLFYKCITKRAHLKLHLFRLQGYMFKHKKYFQPPYFHYIYGIYIPPPHRAKVTPWGRGAEYTALEFYGVGTVRWLVSFKRSFLICVCPVFSFCLFVCILTRNPATLLWGFEESVNIGRLLIKSNL